MIKNATAIVERFAPLLLVLPCLLVYSFSLDHEFIPFLDDTAYIICNGSIQGLSLQNLKTAFTSCYVGNYAPIHILSYLVDYYLSGVRPWSDILLNVLLHAANGVLLHRLLLRSRFSQGAAFAASLFLLHPVQVEAVAWASERKTVLAMLFFLLAVHRYLDWSSAAGGREAGRHRGFSGKRARRVRVTCSPSRKASRSAAEIPSWPGSAWGGSRRWSGGAADE